MERVSMDLRSENEVPSAQHSYSNITVYPQEMKSSIHASVQVHMRTLPFVITARFWKQPSAKETTLNNTQKTKVELNKGKDIPRS